MDGVAWFVGWVAMISGGMFIAALVLALAINALWGQIKHMPFMFDMAVIYIRHGKKAAYKEAADTPKQEPTP